MSSNMVALEEEVTRLRAQILALENGAENEEISVGNYLLTRLEQLGVTKIFGVPGDYNLGFLDMVEDHPTIEWVGCCNELNASYAADGYARVKEKSLGVVLTTFGVGELSAMNGIAGAFSEMVPVLHIVGVPSCVQQKDKPMLHHTLGDGRYEAYEVAAEQFTISQAMIVNKASAAAEIDLLLTTCMTTARPVYLTLPTDVAYATIPSSRLHSRSIKPAYPVNKPEVESFVLDEITKLVKEANGDVVFLVDACAIRHHAREELMNLLEKTRFPVYSTPMGKTAVSERYERYGGIYVGTISHPDIKEKVESAKLIISVGGLKSDFNTGNFTYSIPTSSTIELHSGHTRVQYAVFQGIGMKNLLPKLTERLLPFQEEAQRIPVPPYKMDVPEEKGSVISHSWFWPRVGKFFGPRDVVVAETGTSSFGVLDVPLPEGAKFLAQILWGSIGWTVGSTLGAAMAARDEGMGRTILFIGDGSMQLTVQELSTMMRNDLKPIVFLLNNSGYTIERYLHGENRKYNDISNWKWTSLLTTLGDLDGTASKSYTVHTKEELDKLLHNDEFIKAKKMQLVEVMMERMDAPRALKVQAELSIKTNMYTK